jgi:hypothetical protein
MSQENDAAAQLIACWNPSTKRVKQMLSKKEVNIVVVDKNKMDEADMLVPLMIREAFEEAGGSGSVHSVVGGPKTKQPYALYIGPLVDADKNSAVFYMGPQKYVSERFELTDKEQRSQFEQECMKPASFGLGEKTVYDENVRRGKTWCCQEADGYTYGSDKQLRDTIANLIAAPAENIKVLASRAHLYETGGFFAKHRDTRKTYRPGHFGTIVVFPPWEEFTGGELVVGGEKIDVAALLKDCKPDEYVAVAFLASAEHEVLPVLSGRRWALQYDAFFTHEFMETYSTDCGITGQAVERVERDRLFRLFNCQGDDIIVPANNTYAQSDVVLLGSDQRLNEVMQRLGYHQGVLVALKVRQSDNGGYADEDDEPRGHYYAAQSVCGGTAAVWYLSNPDEGRAISYMKDYITGQDFNMHCYNSQPYCEYTGNESATGHAQYGDWGVLYKRQTDESVSAAANRCDAEDFSGKKLDEVYARLAQIFNSTCAEPDTSSGTTHASAAQA